MEKSESKSGEVLRTSIIMEKGYLYYVVQNKGDKCCVIKRMKYIPKKKEESQDVPNTN